MRAVLKILLIILLVCGQIGFFGHFRPLGVMPNLMLLAVLFFGLYSSATSTLAAAVLGGFLLDSASATDFGLRMAFFSVAALGVITGRQLGLRADSVITALLLVTVGTVLFDFAVISTVSTAIRPGAYMTIFSEVIINNILALAVIAVRLWSAGRFTGQRAAWA